MLWIRGITYPNDYNKIIVHGHTPQLKVKNLPKQINIDTGAYYSGTLTCLLIETKTGKRQFFNAKNKILL